MNYTDNKTNTTCHLDGFGVQKEKTQEEKRKSKKVRFARELEYWKAYDKETGMFISKSLFKDNENTKLGKRNKKTKPQTITDVVQSFQKREADMKHFATLKPHRIVKIGSKEPFHFKVPMKVPNNAFTSCDDNISEYKESATEFKVAFNQTGFQNFNRRKKICQNSMAFTTNQLPVKQTQLFDHEQFARSADFQKNAVNNGLIPSVCNGRKIYDERLLPAIYTERTNPLLGTETLASIKDPLQSTPYIVQLFE